MWGFGGRYYWGRKERVERRRAGGGGIILVFAWMSSQEKHLKNYVQLYASLGWDSLVCHSEFLNMFFPEKAATLAHDLLKELVEESLIRLPQPSSIDVNGVLGQILFDVCVPKDVEGWDMKSSDSSSRHPYTSSLWRNSHFNPIKCIRRSRL
ncbi:hypothetical protein PVK06_015627 [Gossypium arboreum]|uniref:Uncharacterized protein n=1 Tax=Gossypium arboreum TaxID=29729 RepID=A0ABR0PYH9_GOSAR|nr:hypothetical protein PVK06_015627 [Gossypium arboreum]